MADIVNWGILGAAKFAREHMAPALHQANGARLAALATSSLDKAAPFQAMCPDLSIHLEYDTLLADPGVDAVYIPLPHTMHVEWAIKALKAGKHVLVEKPVAMQADQIDPLIAARDDSGLVAAEAYMIVHHPQWQRARQMIRDGAIGQVAYIDTVFTYDNRKDPDNIRNRAGTGGGALPDIGVYILGAARWVTGAEPRSVDCDITWEGRVDATSRVTARFPGFSYSGMVSMRMLPYQRFTIHGDQGVLELTAPFNAGVYDIAQIIVHQPGMGRRVERFPGVNQYKLQVENFCAAVTSGAEYPWTLENAKGTQAVIDAAYAAAGQPS
ncbi:putative oxidoreductase [Actibacterium atlanticum]|uniref:Putative oxidoreductase n=1 Tax=Actibacterium atlanticum TaxID=1461693 RepID=A0A058ZJZ0_9RHOB|nr:Gfo/Idh/MocA family oxidoreductase [Actibacterium atlanticum]KCV81535.1 putative oxidoreductase [Actibacterium atlanticum]